MALYYGMSEVVMLGGSFAALGGQNLIEAAACGCPVVMGPHTFNFSEAADLAVACGAGFRVDDLTQALTLVQSLVQSEARLDAARIAATRFAAAHRGAAHNTARAIVELLAATGAQTARG
jgi:3-deoxy-D-manno-octulosonic-acid transferase